MAEEPTAKISVTEYRLAMHYGLCHGPVDGLEAVYVNEKEAWTGDATDLETVISKPDLFGGKKKEGGVEGRMWIFGGGDTQLMPAEIASKWGGLPATVPGFRGFMSVFFASLSGGRPGFLWSTNTPYVKPVSFKIRRMPKGLTGDAFIGTDANPAHMIYECLTNTVWGMGGATTQIDTANFLAAAQTFRDEGLGLSMIWTGQSKIMDFVQEILDHVEATFFLNPLTGLYDLKPIREDYDVETLPELSPANSRLTNFQRKGFGETVNEINASWTNPLNEQDETVTVHELANIEIQGAIVSSTRNYYGVRKSDTAMRLAQRDLNTSSYPVASCDIEVTQAGWNLVPGAVVKVTWPEHQLSGLVMRVGAVRYGPPGNPGVRATLMEDIFALPDNPYVTPPDSGWVDPSVEPAPLEFTYFGDASYYEVARRLGDAGAEALLYPQSYVKLLMAQDDTDTYEVELLAEGLDSGGTLVYSSMGSRALSGHALLNVALPQAVSSDMPAITNYWGKAGPDVGNFVQFGSTSDGEIELALVESIGVGGPVLRRGVLDTVPRAWPVSTPVWFFNPTGLIFDNDARAATQVVNYKQLTRTSMGLLDPLDAPIETYTVSDRMHRPFRPAKVMVGGVLFAPAVANFSSGSYDFTWANRNRFSETAVLLAWDAASVTPEVGQTVNVVLENLDGSPLYSASGLSGTSHTASVTGSSITGSAIRYLISSEVDGLDSLQAATGLIEMAGYGLNYGNYYGGV